MREFLHYDVFTSEPLTGNQLAVYPDGRGIPAARMQSIAREMNFSETTFVLPAETAGTDARVRIFTPGRELPMAGHPTIGTTFALAERGAIAPGTPRITLGLNIGPIPVDLEWEGSRLRFAWMNQGPPEFSEVVTDRAAAATAIGVEAADLHPDLPVQQVSCGVPYMMIPLRDEAAVDRGVPDVSALRRFADVTHMDHGVFLFTPRAGTDPLEVYSRMFAPDFGVFEDPATGSASGPLGCYLVRHGVAPGGTARIVSHQGVMMQRPSRIHIVIEGTRAAITSVKVGGEAVLVARCELLV